MVLRRASRPWWTSSPRTRGVSQGNGNNDEKFTRQNQCHNYVMKSDLMKTRFSANQYTEISVISTENFT
ncbi:hypothetical protein T4D_16860 [Trichinella pseudospiralis]|uniref:Uncharacterized protein n=1 Tax=Trichinella pseudospiralis TaxID=6337 RepID=A0A0V1FKI5_TRIPS|nr:hypothetical protein T4D_16860 [Trichinella pseudospiralis]